MTTEERIEKLIASRNGIGGRELADRLGVTRQAVNWHIRHLIKQGRIVKSGSTRKARYRPAGSGGEPQFGSRSFQRQFRIEGLEEHRVFREVSLFLGLEPSLSKAALETYQYALTEIVNNAIEHSFSSRCVVSAGLESYEVSFVVEDGGIGIFKSIADKFNLADETEAVVELSKGKRTTQPERHSGEGLFFTSKCADRMEIASHRLRLIYDNRNSDIFVEEIPRRQGTTVSFELKRSARKRLASLFDEYAPEDFDFRFERTRVRVALLNDRYASRSEAKRLLEGLASFRQITLDFKGVTGIGQGFSDEIFRVFARAHPDIEILTENTNSVVARMIDHTREGSLA